MNQKKTLLILLVCFAVLLGGASVLYSRLSGAAAPGQLQTQQPENTQSSASSAPQSIPAPDFTVYDKAGNPVKLSDYLGKPVVLNFWASWCGPCQMEMPDFEEKYLALGQDVQFLMINMTDGARETVDTAADFIAQQGYTFPVVYDTQSEAAMLYGAYSLPMTFFIDANGNAIAQATGAIDGALLQKGIDMITGETNA